MERLTHKTLIESRYTGFIQSDAPERVLQFGEGNFLRAFVDYFFDVLNEKEGFNGKIAMVQPIERGLTDMINEQEGLYTLYLRGSENGEAVMKKRVITSISRCIDPYRDFDVSYYKDGIKDHEIDESDIVLYALFSRPFRPMGFLDFHSGEAGKVAASL